MNMTQIRSRLQDTLQVSAQRGQLTLSRTTFEDDNITHLLDTYYGGTAIVIDNAVIHTSDADSTQTVVTGLASFLNVAHMPVTATFQESSSGVDLILRYQLPVSWRFSHSFPELPATWMPSSDFFSLITAVPATLDPDAFLAPPVSKSSARSILDFLTFTDACFIVSTCPYTDEVQVDAGLSFLCRLKLNGLLGVLETAFQFPDTLILAGPIVLPTLSLGAVSMDAPILNPTGTRIIMPLAGIHLRADAHVHLSIGQLHLTKTYIRFYSPLSSDALQGCQSAPGMLFGGVLQIGENLSVEITAQKNLGDDNHLLFVGNFEGFLLPSLSDLSDLVGADDLAGMLVPPESVPDFFDPSAKLSLKSVSLGITCHPLALDTVGVCVGLEDTVWQPLDDFSVAGLSAHFWIDRPFHASRSLRAGISGILNIKDVSLMMSAMGPNFTLTAHLLSSHTIPLQNLFDLDMPDIPGIGDLALNGFYIEIQPGNGFSLMTSLADRPQPWEITLGPETLTMSDMQFL